MISGTRRSFKELVDGTIRLQIDIEPIDKAKFFELFPNIDMPVAIAPLRIEAVRHLLPIKKEPEEDIKGGELCKWAGILCRDEGFWEFLNHSGTLDCHGIKVISEALAAQAVRALCFVNSRADIDINKESAHMFRKLMANFDEWKNG